MRTRRSHRALALDRTPVNAFDYLLREPGYARRQRRMSIAAGILALTAIACVLYGCT
jgi:hypothetical protein